MWNAWLSEAQAGIKIARRNNNNLGYADDTTLMAEIEEELKSLLMKVKEESEKASLKLSIEKTKIAASNPIISWQVEGQKMEMMTDFIFLGSKITAGGICSYEIKWCLLLGRKAMNNLKWSEVKSLSRVRLFATPWTVASRLLDPWDFPGMNTGVGCYFLLQGNLPDPGIEHGSPAL